MTLSFWCQAFNTAAIYQKDQKSFIPVCSGNQLKHKKGMALTGMADGTPATMAPAAACAAFLLPPPSDPLTLLVLSFLRSRST